MFVDLCFCAYFFIYNFADFFTVFISINIEIRWFSQFSFQKTIICSILDGYDQVRSEPVGSDLHRLLVQRHVPHHPRLGRCFLHPQALQDEPGQIGRRHGWLSWFLFLSIVTVLKDNSTNISYQCTRSPFSYFPLPFFLIFSFKLYICTVQCTLKVS